MKLLEESGFFIEPLGAQHDRAGFSSGNVELDRYLYTQASQDLRRQTSVPFVITPDHTTVAGFYTLSQHAVDVIELPAEIARKLPRYPLLPATLLGRLAVSTQFRGQGLGETLLLDALFRSLQTSKQVASFAIIVDAKDASAAAFYKKYGFLELPRVPHRFFLPMNTVETLLSESK